MAGLPVRTVNLSKARSFGHDVSDETAARRLIGQLAKLAIPKRADCYAAKLAMLQCLLDQGLVKADLPGDIFEQRPVNLAQIGSWMRAAARESPAVDAGFRAYEMKIKPLLENLSPDWLELIQVGKDSKYAAARVDRLAALLPQLGLSTRAAPAPGSAQSPTAAAALGSGAVQEGLPGPGPPSPSPSSSTQGKPPYAAAVELLEEGGVEVELAEGTVDQNGRPVTTTGRLVTWLTRMFEHVAPGTSDRAKLQRFALGALLRQGISKLSSTRYLQQPVELLSSQASMIAALREQSSALYPAPALLRCLERDFGRSMRSVLQDTACASWVQLVDRDGREYALLRIDAMLREAAQHAQRGMGAGTSEGGGVSWAMAMQPPEKPVSEAGEIDPNAAPTPTQLPLPLGLAAAGASLSTARDSAFSSGGSSGEQGQPAVELGRAVGLVPARHGSLRTDVEVALPSVQWVLSLQQATLAVEHLASCDEVALAGLLSTAGGSGPSSHSSGAADGRQAGNQPGSVPSYSGLLLFGRSPAGGSGGSSPAGGSGVAGGGSSGRAGGSGGSSGRVQGYLLDLHRVPPREREAVCAQLGRLLSSCRVVKVAHGGRGLAAWLQWAYLATLEPPVWDTQVALALLSDLSHHLLGLPKGQPQAFDATPAKTELYEALAAQGLSPMGAIALEGMPEGSAAPEAVIAAQAWAASQLLRLKARLEPQLGACASAWACQLSLDSWRPQQAQQQQQAQQGPAGAGKFSIRGSSDSTQQHAGAIVGGGGNPSCWAGPNGGNGGNGKWNAITFLESGSPLDSSTGAGAAEGAAGQALSYSLEFEGEQFLPRYTPLQVSPAAALLPEGAEGGVPAEEELPVIEPLLRLFPKGLQRAILAALQLISPAGLVGRGGQGKGGDAVGEEGGNAGEEEGGGAGQGKRGSAGKEKGGSSGEEEGGSASSLGSRAISDQGGVMGAPSCTNKAAGAAETSSTQLGVAHIDTEQASASTSGSQSSSEQQSSGSLESLGRGGKAGSPGSTALLNSCEGGSADDASRGLSPTLSLVHGEGSTAALAGALSAGTVTATKEMPALKGVPNMKEKPACEDDADILAPSKRLQLLHSIAVDQGRPPVLHFYDGTWQELTEEFDLGEAISRISTHISANAEAWLRAGATVGVPGTLHCVEAVLGWGGGVVGLTYSTRRHFKGLGRLASDHLARIAQAGAERGGSVLLVLGGNEDAGASMLRECSRALHDIHRHRVVAVDDSQGSLGGAHEEAHSALRGVRRLLPSPATPPHRLIWDAAARHGAQVLVLARGVIGSCSAEEQSNLLSTLLKLRCKGVSLVVGVDSISIQALLQSHPLWEFISAGFMPVAPSRDATATAALGRSREEGPLPVSAVIQVLGQQEVIIYCPRSQAGQRYPAVERRRVGPGGSIIATGIGSIGDAAVPAGESTFATGIGSIGDRLIPAASAPALAPGSPQPAVAPALALAAPAHPPEQQAPPATAERQLSAGSGDAVSDAAVGAASGAASNADLNASFDEPLDAGPWEKPAGVTIEAEAQSQSPPPEEAPALVAAEQAGSGNPVAHFWLDDLLAAE